MPIKRFYRSFLYSASCSSGEEEANCFIATHEILSCERKVVVTNDDVKILLLFEYAGESNEFSHAVKKQYDKKPWSRDVKTIKLNSDEERVYRLLCERRRAITNEKGVPPYNGGTNFDLQQIVRLRCASKADLKQIKGFGEAKINDYGLQYLAIMSAEIPSLTQETPFDESKSDDGSASDASLYAVE